MRYRNLGLAGILAGCAIAPPSARQSALGQPNEATTQPADAAVVPATRPALVQGDPGAAVLPESIIRGTPQSITAPGIPVAREQLNLRPGAVDLIPAEAYERGRTQTTKDVLDYTPGVIAQPRNGNTAEESRLSIRGSGVQRTFHLRGIELLQDGVPINLADGSADFEAIEPLALRYTEVYRGGNALRYGSATLGGAINFVSRTGHDASPFQVRAEAGSFGYVRGQVSSGQVVGPWDYYLSLTAHTADGYRDHSQNDGRRLYGNVGYRVADDVETRFFFNASNYDSEIPGGLTKQQLEDAPQRANGFQLGGHWQRNVDLVRLANKTTFRGDGQTFDVIAFYTYKDLDHPIFQVINDKSNDFGVNLRYTNENDLFGRRNILTAGFNAHRGVLDHNQFLNVGGARLGARTQQGDQSSTNFTLYAEDQHYVTEKVAVILGVQATHARRNFDDFFLENGDQSDSFNFDALNPKVGVRYEFTEQSQAYANYSRSFEPPSFGELSNLGGTGLLNLDAQSADTVEIGLRGRNDRLAWDVAYYYARVHDELLGFNVGPGQSPLTVNADDTIHQGVELGLTVTLLEVFPRGLDQNKGDRLVLRNAYTWGDFRFNDDDAYGDNRLAGLPEHYLRAELLYEHRSGLYFGPNVEWSMRKYPVDLANNLYADPYVLLGFQIGFRNEKGFSAFVEARNLLDENYAASTGVITDASLAGANLAQFNPGDGRAFYFGLEFRY